MKNLSLIVLFIELCCMGPVFSTTYYVKPNATGNGSSWSNATTLQAALDKALNDGDIILIAKGTYIPSIPLGNGLSDRDKTFEIKHNISLIGGYSENAQEGDTPHPEENKTILSGLICPDCETAEVKAFHVVTVTASPHPEDREKKVYIQGIVIQNGGIPIRSSYDDITSNNKVINQKRGGGLIAVGAKIKLENVIFENNESGEMGSIALTDNSEGEMIKVISQNNVSHSGMGGGFSVYKNSSVTLNQCIIQENKASNGGSVYVYDNSRAELTGCVIQNNYTTNGTPGAYSRLNSTVTLNECILRGIYMNPAGGTLGVLTSFDYATLNAYNCYIAGNKSSNPDLSTPQNGVIAGARGSTATTNPTGKSGSIVNIINCTIENNFGRSLFYCDNGSLAFTNAINVISSTIVDNTFPSNEESVYINRLSGNYCKISFYNSLISNNIYTYNGIIKEALLWENTPVKNCIYGETVYDGMNSATGQSFYRKTMLENEVTKENVKTPFFKLTDNENNGAVGNGMTRTELNTLKNRLALNSTVTQDQSGAERNDEYKIIGAVGLHPLAGASSQSITPSPVFSSYDKLYIISETNNTAAIYDLNNRLVAHYTIQVGLNIFTPGQKGIYTIYFNNKYYTVYID